MPRQQPPADGFLDIGTVKDKALRPPDLYNYNNNPAEYKAWRDRLRAFIKVQHSAVPWNYILTACEGMKQAIITEDHVAVLMYNARIRESDRESVESSL